MRGQGAARRERLGRAAGLARELGLAAPRVARFSRRLAGEAAQAPPTLEDLCGWPEWPACGTGVQSLVFATSALLAGGAALREEISGAVLREIGARVGEDLLEQVLASCVAGDLPLPEPEALKMSGHALALSALPAPLAEQLGQGPEAGWDDAARFIAEAERLVRPASFASEAT